jgi:hypothetical protein
VDNKSSTSVAVKICVTPSDFYGLQIRFLARKMWCFPIVLGPLLYASGLPSVFAGILGVIAGVTGIALAPLAQLRSAKKHNPYFLAPTEYGFSEHGISLEGPVSSVRLDWAAIKRCTETDKYLLIHMPPEWFYIIPKRELSQAELQDITEILRTCPPVAQRLGKKR